MKIVTKVTHESCVPEQQEWEGAGVLPQARDLLQARDLPQYEPELEAPSAKPHGVQRWANFVGWSALFLLGLWVAAATIYIVMHDELLSAAIKERNRLQNGYEARITALRRQLADEINQRQLDQHMFAAQLDQLVARQQQLEARHGKIMMLGSDADHPALDVTGSGPTLRPNPSAAPSVNSPGTGGPDVAAEPPIASALNKIIELNFSAEPEKMASSRLPASVLHPTTLPVRPVTDVEHRLIEVANAQNRLETQQSLALNQMEIHAEKANTTLRKALRALGVAHNQNLGAAPPAEAPNSQEATGGPSEPALLGGQFSRQLTRTYRQLSHATTLHRTLLSYPVHAPLPGEHKITSFFGNRTDPFYGRPAFHSGIDFSARRGVEVRATAPGRVTKSGWHAGYGRMVEITHANGIVSRYAHMSSISVTAGESVQPGQRVGLVGSSGRSTGPHLHYEIRRTNQAINPLPFLKIGERYLQQ